MASRRIVALKRIANDMRELSKCPLEGIGIAPAEEDPMKFIINLEIMMGLYEGYKLQLLLLMSDDYPIKPPKILIYPNQMINSRYHHHIFDAYEAGYEGYKKFCFDLLDNDFHMNTSAEYTGWNPAYTISTILLQVQNFISNPDLPEDHLPNKAQIEKLMKSMEKYAKTFLVKDEKEVNLVVHTWKDPYPKMSYKQRNEMETMEIDEMENPNQINEPKEEEETKMRTIKENLTCYMLRDNYIDNPEILLGYPIVQSKSAYGKEKVELYPIPQLLTYEAYTRQTSQNQNNQNSQNMLIGQYYDNGNKLKAANNEYFNNWFPIYVDEKHFSKNRETFMNSLKSIKNESEFKPEQVFDILPILLNKMIIGMFKGKSVISSAFIICYYQYILLFKKLCKEYEDDYEKYINKKISLITMNDYEVNKKIVPDIGDFLMLIFLSNKDVKSPEMKKMKDTLIEEFLIRQIYWIFHGPECGHVMKEKVMKVNSEFTDEEYLDMFESDPNFKMHYLDIFVKQLHKLNIYDDIIRIISSDNGFQYQYYNDWKYAKQMAEKRITQSFKKLFNECSQWGKKKIRTLILEHMHFKDFFEKEEESVKSQMYEQCKVDELLKGKNGANIEEVLKYAYESQRGNQLLLITFFALKKLEQPGFMEELEKNFGIYLKVDDFVQELKQKLEEVKSYKALYEYLGTDLGKDKTELEIILQAYQKAKAKRYIRDPYEQVKINQARARDNKRWGYKNGYGYGW